jgi:hypothetical protein
MKTYTGGELWFNFFFTLALDGDEAVSVMPVPLHPREYSFDKEYVIGVREFSKHAALRQ